MHIVGKTLASLSFYLEDPILKMNSNLLGWSLYEKWERFECSLQKVIRDKLQISQDVVRFVFNF